MLIGKIMFRKERLLSWVITLIDGVFVLGTRIVQLFPFSNNILTVQLK